MIAFFMLSIYEGHSKFHIASLHSLLRTKYTDATSIRAHNSLFLWNTHTRSLGQVPTFPPEMHAA